MNFAQAAHEIVRFVTHERILSFGIAALAVLGGSAARAGYKKHKAERAEVEAILKRVPVVKPVNLPDPH